MSRRRPEAVALGRQVCYNQHSKAAFPKIGIVSWDEGGMMSGLEKFLLVFILLLAIGVTAILLMPDKSGQGGFQSLSPTMSRVSQVLAGAFASIEYKFVSWTGSVQAWVRQATSSSSVSNGQTNPVDSAVNPVGDYGEVQKDEFGKPLEGLQK
jgi:hypothetical protein